MLFVFKDGEFPIGSQGLPTRKPYPTTSDLYSQDTLVAAKRSRVLGSAD